MHKIELIDGAMGSEFIRTGITLPNHVWSANVNIEAEEIVYQIHRKYVKAGSQYLTTNTFRSTKRSYMKTGLNIEDATLLAKNSLKNAVDIANRASDNCKVLGSIAPLEDCYKPEDFPGKDIAFKEFSEIGKWFSETKIDIFLVETMNSIIETQTCLSAIEKYNIPIWVSFILKDDKNILSGESLTDAIKMLNKHNIKCMLINCTPLHTTMGALDSISDNWNKRWGIYPNLGIGEPSPSGDIKTIHSNDNFIKLIYKSIEKGATVIGGCCGSTPEHISFLRGKMNKFQFYKQ